MKKEFSKLIYKNFIIFFITFGIHGILFADVAPWCEKSYDWDNKINVSYGEYNDGTSIGLFIETTKSIYNKDYEYDEGYFYYNGNSDLILKYYDNENNIKHFIIKGKMIQTSMYKDLKEALGQNFDFLKYLTCNQKYNSETLLKNSYQKTPFKLKITYNKAYSVTNGSEKIDNYGFNHNLALAFIEFSKAITGFTSIGTASLDDKFLAATTEYFLGLAYGRSASLYLELTKDNITTKEIFKIVLQELKEISKFIKKSSKYKELASYGLIGNQIYELSNSLEKETQKGKTLSEASVIMLSKKVDQGAKKAFDLLFKFTGLTYAKKGAESFSHFLSGTSILIDMKRDKFKKYFINNDGVKKFNDIQIDKSSLSKSVYFLLSNFSISSPNKNRNFNFYPNTDITANELSVMIVNTFLYDEYKTSKYKNMLDYLNNNFLNYLSFDLKVNDKIKLKKFDEILNNIFKYKINKLSQDIYGEKAKAILFNNWDKYNIAKARIKDLKKTDILTRGNSAILLVNTYLNDWTKLFNKERENQLNLVKNKLTGRGAVLPYKPIDKINIYDNNINLNYELNFIKGDK